MRRFAIPRRLGMATALLVSVGLVLYGPAPSMAVKPQVRFRPRLGFAMGLIPRAGALDPASGPAQLVVYHGGQVMRGVTLHTVFWAPAGYHFDGSPGNGAPGYEALVKQFLVDAVRGGPADGDVFSTLTQFHDRSGPGDPQLSYDPAVNSVDLSSSYPARDSQCASPAGVATCITDAQLQSQLDSLIAADSPRARGLSNLWIVFLPPNVDTCILAGSCATDAYAGYHSAFDRGHGTTVYAPVPDPLLGLTPPAGSDPQGNPEGEFSLNTVAHEVVEAVTDPYGTGWMDPIGMETGDKCEIGPQPGTPLGYAPDGSPYNQILNGHEYLLQEMWANNVAGCVQGSTAPGPVVDLPSVSLRQFSPWVRGSLGHPGRATVHVELDRALAGVATATAQTRPDGSWGPVRLHGPAGAVHAAGDDRELLLISYGFGPGVPPPEAIATGGGGNPFAQAGYTGWSNLDNGVFVGASYVHINPCGQVGVLALRIGPRLTEPPAQLCSTQTDTASVATGPIGPGTRILFSSEDNRASLPGLTPEGALVKLTISPGEPGAFPYLVGGTDLPTCDAYLREEIVRCGGLVAHSRYRLAGRRVRADITGVVSRSGLRLHGGQVITLVNRAGRRLTSLHVAHLRVDLTANQTRVAGGSCQPGDFYGRAPSPASGSGGLGGAIFSATICPRSGQARGLSTATIAQSDDLSGGRTVVSVPQIESTMPLANETLYGAFRAWAQSGLPGPNGSVVAPGTPVSLRITPVGARRAVFSAANVDTARGVGVRALALGTYVAQWRLHDANGDTRSLSTRFVEAG